MKRAMSASQTEPGVRLDVWLWAARFFRSRSLAKAAIAAGRVSINDQVAKPARNVRIGDRLRVVRAGETIDCLVEGLAEARGPASVAQTLWRETEASKLAREAERERRRLDAQGYRPPLKRPDKRARRLIAMLGDLDAV